MSTFIPWTATVLVFRAFDAVLEMVFSWVVVAVRVWLWRS